MIVKDLKTGNKIRITQDIYNANKERYKLPEFDFREVVIEEEIIETKEVIQEIKEEKQIEKEVEKTEQPEYYYKPKGRPKKNK